MDRQYRVRMGALLRSTANDLKRNASSAAHDLGIPESSYQDMIEGRRDIPSDVVARIAERWPVNERDVMPVHNDCPLGVTVFPAEDSVASARVIRRGGTDYYEYRDTAMSRLSSFRPEWIKMLSVVDDDSPENPAVQWNNGHLLYQFTYFVGPVNYYYRWQERTEVLRMETGDSIWGQPFSPHTFTSRDAGQEAFILALTYGGELTGDARHELSALGRDISRRFTVSQPTTFQRCLDAAMLTVDEVARRTGWSPNRTADIVDGKTSASHEELAVLADVLRVSVRDLLPVGVDSPGGICLQRAAGAQRWPYPSSDRTDYVVTELAGNRMHPYTRALEIRPRQTGTVGAPVTTHQHQYLYNVGDSALLMHWDHGRGHEATLRPGDSAYVMPFVACSYGVNGPGEDPRLLALRVSGAVTDTVRTALGAMHSGGLDRMIQEDRSWYREE